MTLTEIKRRLRPGQMFMVTNHELEEQGFAPVMARVHRLTGQYGFYLEHALGQTKVTWPPARHITRDDDGTLHLRTAVTGTPFLTLAPTAATAAGEGNHG
jgi:hypothetical protein